MERKKSALANILLLLGVVIIMLLMLEVFFRFTMASYSHTLGGPGMIRLVRSTHFNNAGFRNTNEIALQKDGKIRIAVLGDSMTFGHGIRKTEDTWPEQLEYYLNNRFNNTYEVMNATWLGYRN